MRCQTNNKSSFIASIQVLRAIAVLIVVLVHLGTAEFYYLKGNHFLFPWCRAGNIGVDIFFVISGFIMVSTTQSMSPGYSTCVTFLTRRFIRIYPIYWGYCLLNVLQNYIFSLLSEKRPFEPRFLPLLKSFSLFPQVDLPLILVSWSLTYEVWFYLVFGLLLFFKRSWLFGLLVIWLAFIVAGNTNNLAAAIGYNLANPGSTPIWNTVFGPLSAEFIMGCFIALLCLKIKPRKLPALILLLLASMAIAYSFYYAAIYGMGEGWRRILYCGLPSALLVASFVYGEKAGIIYPPKSLLFIGDASYSIYLSHFMIIGDTFLLTHITLSRLSIPLDNPILHIAAILLALCACLVGGAVSYKYIELPLTNTVRALIKR
ncbi:MAG: acyltransferase [Deltaproteobacteria bacterium]|nr:acyltransferase [Deltaproteobacteria bacterium]